MNNDQERSVLTYCLPIKDKETILKTEKAIIKYGTAGTIDIGSLCYVDRSENKKRMATTGYLVNLSSLNKNRINHVKKIIDLISDEFLYSGLAHNTLLIYAKTFLYFVDWADKNNYQDLFDDLSKAKNSLIKYVFYLKEQIIKNNLSASRAVNLQNISFKFLENFYSVENLSVGIPLIYENQENEYTSPPNEASQSRTLSLCESLFEGISDVILNNQPFPYQLTVPQHIGWSNNSFYIFPIIEWAVNPTNFKEKQGFIWNQEEGRTKNKEEIINLYKTSTGCNSAIYKAKKILLENNSHNRSLFRLKLATVAHNAFAVIFLANTGMNRESMLNLTWSDDYETEVERQGFRSIKQRAGGKLCHFELSMTMMPKFKKFLRLRKYLLGENTSENLFISLGTNASQSPKRLNGSAFYHIFETLENLDPKIKKITPREWRAAKSDWLIKNTDVSTASLMLQNSEQVLMKHYTKGSETQHFDELGKFFNQVSKFVLDKSDNGSIESSAVGACSSFGNPTSLNNSPVKVNCKSPEGCLFCDKYKIHADEKDVRKLISCRYCLEKTSQLSNSQEDFDKVFGVIFNRIDEILNEIEKIKPGITSKIDNEVKELGELDPYWARKLELLFDLGLVS